MISPERLAELERLASEAMPNDWCSNHWFISKMMVAVPELLAEIRELRTALKKFKYLDDVVVASECVCDAINTRNCPTHQYISNQQNIGIKDE